MEFKAEKCRCAAILCTFGPAPQPVLFSRSPDQVLQGNAELTTFSFKPLNLKGKCPVEVLLVGETLQAVCKLPWLAIFLYQLLAPKNVIQILLGPFPTT